jgi:transposase
LRRVHALARTSVGVQEGIQALQLALGQHIETLQHLQRQLNQADEALTDLFLALLGAEHMLSIHGLGTLTAAIILSEIGDPSRYRAASQLVKLAGTHGACKTGNRAVERPVPSIGPIEFGLVSGKRARCERPNLPLGTEDEAPSGG